MSGLFGSLFDFNGDGELSTGEKAFGFAAIMSALSALEDAEVSVSCSFDDEDLDDMDRDELEAKLEELRDERDDEPVEEVMHYEGGIRQFVEHLNRTKTPLHDQVIYMEGSRDTSMAEVAMQYTDSYSD